MIHFQNFSGFNVDVQFHWLRGKREGGTSEWAISVWVPWIKKGLSEEAGWDFSMQIYPSPSLSYLFLSLFLIFSLCSLWSKRTETVFLQTGMLLQCISLSLSKTSAQEPQHHWQMHNNGISYLMVVHPILCIFLNPKIRWLIRKSKSSIPTPRSWGFTQVSSTLGGCLKCRWAHGRLQTEEIEIFDDVSLIGQIMVWKVA